MVKHSSRGYLREKARRKLAQQSTSQQVATVERAIKETAKETGLSDKEVSQALLPEIMTLNVQPELHFINPKVEEIVNRIQRSIPDMEKAEELKGDSKLNNLYIDLAKAKKEKKFLTETIIQRQIENRAKDVLILQAERKMARLVENGGILDYLEKEYADRIQAANLQYYLTLQMIDSALLDLKSAIEQAGMVGEVRLLPEIEKVRNEITEWCGSIQKQYGDEGHELVMNEFDNIYDFYQKRLPVLQRKINKKINK